MKERLSFVCAAALFTALGLPSGCSDPAAPSTTTGNASASGAANQAGMTAGGGASGGAAPMGGMGPAAGSSMAGSSVTGTMPSGGTPSGGTSSGGMPSGGTASAGMPSAGASSGGMAAMGGNMTGGMPATGGSGVAGGGECPVAGASNSGQNPAPTFETVKAVMDFGCYGAQCHDLEEHPLHLKGTDEEIIETMKTHMVQKCDGALVVNTASPADSALVRVLSGACGDIPRMPPTCMGCDQYPDNTSCIPDDYIQAIQQWIADGALP